MRTKRHAGGMTSEEIRSSEISSVTGLSCHVEYMNPRFGVPFRTHHFARRPLQTICVAVLAACGNN